MIFLKPWIEVWKDLWNEIYFFETKNTKLKGWIWHKETLLQTELPNDVDIDLDEILDIEDENQRKKFIHVSLFQGKVLVLKLYLE